METELMKQARKRWDDWFFSDEGELVAKGVSHGGGYHTGDKRRTVDSQGHITTRYTFTLPDGTVQLHTEFGDGCHSGAEGDHCGCDKCVALYGPWCGDHRYERK